METKHTPGPWRVGPYNLHIFADNAKIGGDTMVCEIRGWGYLTGNGNGALGLVPAEAVDIQEANARLIAAAPTMLEALKGAVGALEFSRDYHRDLGNEEQAFAQDKLDAVLAAISSAQGEAS